jgi:hypothetical protein
MYFSTTCWDVSLHGVRLSDRGELVINFRHSAADTMLSLHLGLKELQDMLDGVELARQVAESTAAHHPEPPEAT